jgi:signal transduction histidine kinase
LHTKTILLVSAITVAVLAAMLVVVSVRVAGLVRDEEKDRAELLAVSLAEHISGLPSPRNLEEIGRYVQLSRRARLNVVSVRVYERSGDVFIERVTSAGSVPAEEIPEETREALRSGLPSQVVAPLPAAGDDSLYRVFAPVTEQGRVSGAVEVVERLDSVPSLARSLAKYAVVIALMAVVLMTLGATLMFRHLVYRPVELLLGAMRRAEEGALDARAPVRTQDEMGRLTAGFNRMIGRLGEMTVEREAQQEILREKVREATSELQHRNRQLAAANIELWQTTRRLAQMERLAAAGQTAAQFAHEVGTPLNLIGCHVELLRDGLPESAQSRADIISEQIERISAIVRRMLDRTRAERTEPEPVNLNALVERICDATAPTLEARHVKLTTSFDPDALSIAGEPDRLQQVFINLINNALDAMPEGGELSIATSVGRAAGAGHQPQAIVTVADTGCGMSEQTRARIFDPLFTAKEKGTGLGLAVVSQIIETHGGRIEVESAPGQGSRFRLSFPRIKPERRGQ